MLESGVDIGSHGLIHDALFPRRMFDGDAAWGIFRFQANFTLHCAHNLECLKNIARFHWPPTLYLPVCFILKNLLSLL